MSGKRMVRLEIEDFQSHQHTVIELSPGLTIFTGPTDQGKSAIRRAVELLYCNEHSSTDNIRMGSNRMRVSVLLEDGTRVTRERTASGSTNCYILELPGELPQKLEGFGREVPQIIQEALGVRPIFLSGEPVYLNFAEQVEAPFLLSAPGSVRAEAIGRLTGVNLIDEATDEVVYDEQTALRAAKQAREVAETTRAKLQQYADLPEKEALLAKLEGYLARAEEIQERLSRLRTFAEQIHDWKQRMRSVQETLKRLEHIEAAQENLIKAKMLSERLARLRELQDRYEANIRAIADVSATLARTAGVERAEQLTARAAEIASRLESIRSLQARWLDYEKQQSENEVLLQATANLPEAEAALAKATGIRARLQELARLDIAWKQNQESLSLVEAEIQQTSFADSVSQKLEKAKVIIERLEKLREFERRIKEWKQQMRPLLKEIPRLMAEEERLVAEYRETLVRNGYCPTCGQTINPEVLEQHLKGAAL